MTIREWLREHEKPDECIYCGTKGPLTTEHILPRSCGGPDIPDNAIRVCRSCNSGKGGRQLCIFLLLWPSLIMEDYTELFQRGNQLFQQKKYIEALEIFERLTAIAPNIPEFWEKKGCILSELKRSPEALRCVNKGLELNPNTASAWYNKGVILTEMKKFPEALDSFDKSLELDLTFASSWYNRGNILVSLHRFDESLDSYDHAIKIDPSHAEFWNNKGNVLNNIGKHEEAILHFNRAIELDPFYVEPLDNKGISLEKLGQYQDAIEFYDKALSISPKNCAALTNKASALIVSEKFSDALDLINQALAIKSDIAIPWNTKGVIFTRLKKFREAIDCFDRAVSIDAHYSTAWFNKGYCICKLEQIQEISQSITQIPTYDHVVFISYADPDRERAFDICNSLESNGIKCWLAFRDIRPATDWPSEIVKALKKSKLCLLIFSHAANEAEGVFNEVNIADRAKIPIIPCRIENVEPSEYLEYQLSRRQYLDFYQGDSETNLKKLVEIIRKNLH